MSEALLPHVLCTREYFLTVAHTWLVSIHCKDKGPGTLVVSFKYIEWCILCVGLCECVGDLAELVHGHYVSLTC